MKALSAKALAWVKTLPPCETRDRAAAAGAPADVPPKRTAKPAAAAVGGKPPLDREAAFKQKDTNGDGTMSLEEYLHTFPDEAEGRRRFPTFDANKDGVLSREEFVTMGKGR